MTDFFTIRRFVKVRSSYFMEMQAKKSNAAKKAESTQKFLGIAEVKGDTIILKNGGLRAVLVVSSTNFALKSQEEQNALTAGYQNFLNSLDFPLQILMQSRILDINSYLEKLRELETSQTNELLRIQMNEYIEYIAGLIEYASIMSKTFYVVIPFSSQPVKETLGSKIMRMFNPAAEIVTHQEDFEKAKVRLDERVAHVMGALGGMGLRTMRFGTEELIELLYSSYNFEGASPLSAETVEQAELAKT